MGPKHYENRARRHWWSIHVEAWRRSGLSRRRYCREHRLCEETMARWLNVLVGAEKLLAEKELAREQRGRKRRPNLTTDKRNRAAQAFWAMHVEAQRWSGMTALDYSRAHRISTHSLARWRDLIDAGETPAEWRWLLHPSARPPISTIASTSAKPVPPDYRLTGDHVADVARDKRPKRRSFTHDEKRAIVLETEVAGATVSSVARRHDVVLGMIYRWREQLGLKKERLALLAEVSVTGKQNEGSPAAVVLHGLLQAPSGSAVALRETGRTPALTNAEPEALRRRLEERVIAP